MVYKVAICDDCEPDRAYLSALVEDWASAEGNQAAVRAFPSAEAFWFYYEEQKDFDILLLDIEMGRQNGVELAGKVREDNAGVQIVFVTGFPDFLEEGYEVAALHYLMKPVSAQKLSAVLDRAAANLAKPEKRLRVSFDRQSVFVPLDRILYIEAQKQYVRIHTEDGDYRMKASLGEMEEALDEYFLKCQRSFLINLRHVVRIGNKSAFLKNGEEIPISRGMAEEIGRAVIRLF